MEDVWAFMGSSGRGNDDFELLEAVPMRDGIIGSDEACTLRLSDPMITSRHARLERVDGDWFLSQVAVASPTFINQTAIEPGLRTSIHEGDLITMGTARFLVGGEPPARDPLTESGSGTLTGVSFRQADLKGLERMCSESTGNTLERVDFSLLTTEEGGRSEEETARCVLQILAATRPPRLRHLTLGWLHENTQLRGAERDWAAVARRVPLEGAIHAAVRRAGRARMTMLRSSAPWPPIGACVELAGVVSHDGARPWRTTGVPSVHAALGRASVIFGKDLVINGSRRHSGSQPLVHGDLVEGPDFAFRFEED